MLWCIYIQLHIIYIYCPLDIHRVILWILDEINAVLFSIGRQNIHSYIAFYEDKHNLSLF